MYDQKQKDKIKDQKKFEITIFILFSVVLSEFFSIRSNLYLKIFIPRDPTNFGEKLNKRSLKVNNTNCL